MRLPPPPPAESRITALEPDPRRDGSVRVLLDGRSFCAIPIDAVAVAGLVVGEQLTDVAREGLVRAADEEAAFRTALRSLERRGFARRDLTRRLRQKGHPHEAIDAALVRAERLGLLDDAVYARDYVETRAQRGRGPARLRRDLLALGVDGRIVEAALTAAQAEGRDGLAAVRTLAERRARSLRNLPREVRQRRLTGYLARRGVTGEEARSLLRDLVG